MLIQEPFQVVTPTVDGSVLSVLAQTDTWFTVGQLERVLPFSDEGIRRVLRRLERQGIVYSQAHGAVTTFCLNREHLAAEAVTAIARLRTTLADRLQAELDSWHVPAIYAAIFGSAARGTMTSESDIDLLVVRRGPDDPAWAAQVSELSGRVTRWTGNDARVLDLGLDEVRPGVPVLQEVVREGLTLLGDPSWFRRRVRGGAG